MREVASVVYSLGREISHTKWAETVVGSESSHTRGVDLHSATCANAVGSSLRSHSLYGQHRTDQKSQSVKCKKLNWRREPEPGFFLHLCSTKRASAGKKQAHFLLEQKAQNMVLFWKSSPGAPNGKINSCGSKRLPCELNSIAWRPSGCLLCLYSPVLTAGLSLTSGFPWCWEQHSHHCAVCASRLETASSRTASC